MIVMTISKSGRSPAKSGDLEALSYILESIHQVTTNPFISCATYTVMIKLFNEDAVINCVECLFQINKNAMVVE